MSRGHSLRFTRWAARLSVRALFLPPLVQLEQLGLWVEDGCKVGESLPDPKWVAPRSCYLSTLTFADPEPDYHEARARWDSFRVWLERREKFGVFAAERGEKTGRLHFHLVHSKRWNAGEMWEVLPRYGFGRYDVRRRPVWRRPPSRGFSGELHPAAWYLTKYVSKRSGDGFPARAKRWGVFGAKYFPRPPCRVCDVEITSKVLTVVPESPSVFSDGVEWRFEGHQVVCCHVSRTDFQGAPNLIMRELSKIQQAKVLELLATGDVVGVGEYRFCNVETKSMDQYRGGVKTGNREERVIVTHRIDFGVGCERREFDELLPVGSDPKAVTPPAKSGALVAVAVDGQRAFTGGVNYKGRVFSLEDLAKPVAAS